jgi:hypothetical protein
MEWCLTWMRTMDSLCKTSAFGCEPRWILGAVQRFGKHCSCHPRGGYVFFSRSWLSYVLLHPLPTLHNTTTINRPIVFTLRMAAVMFAVTLDSSRYSTLPTLESRSFTLNSSRKNLKKIKYKHFSYRGEVSWFWWNQTLLPHIMIRECRRKDDFSRVEPLEAEVSFSPWRWGGSSTQAWMPTYVSILRIRQMIWVWRATVEWYWRGKTCPVPLCPPQIPHGLTRASAVRGRRLTTWAMARPTKSVLVIFEHSVPTSNKTRTHKHNKDQLVTSVKEIIPVYSEIRNFVFKTQNYWLLQQVVHKGDCCTRRTFL